MTQDISSSQAHRRLVFRLLVGLILGLTAALPCRAAGNMVLNPDFENGLSPWHCQFKGGASGVDYRDGATHESGDWSETVRIRKATPSAPGNAELSQAGLNFAANETVTVSFFAKSNVARASILCAVGHSSPGRAAIAQQKFELSGTWRRYSFDFVPSKPVSEEQIEFDLGAIPQQVWIDQVYVGDAPEFEDDFNKGSLDTTRWNSFITDPSASGWPWSVQSGQPQNSSALDRPNKFDATYDLPSMITESPGQGLDLSARKGATANGYTWTGSVICSCPDSRLAQTKGYTFEDAYVEVCAKLPAASHGEWPAIWFLAGPGSHGGEIDLHEGGYPQGSPDPDRVIACNLHTTGNKQVFVDAGEGLSQGFHIFGMAYKPGQYVKMYLDGKMVASYTTNVPVGAYYIIINDDMASAQTASWHSQIGAATPTSNHMLVAYVRVTSL